MKKNGFTLAELLGVIVILAAIALVAFPPIINQIKKSRGDLDNALNTVILTASEQYLEENNKSLSGIYCIKLNVLVNDGKLSDPITDSNGSIVPLNSIFYIDYNSNNYFYSVFTNENDIPQNRTKCDAIDANRRIYN